MLNFRQLLDFYLSKFKYSYKSKVITHSIKMPRSVLLRLMGISQPYYSQIALGKRPLSVNLAKKLDKFFKTSKFSEYLIRNNTRIYKERLLRRLKSC